MEKAINSVSRWYNYNMAVLLTMKELEITPQVVTTIRKITIPLENNLWKSFTAEWDRIYSLTPPYTSINELAALKLYHIAMYPKSKNKLPQLFKEVSYSQSSNFLFSLLLLIRDNNYMEGIETCLNKLFIDQPKHLEYFSNPTVLETLVEFEEGKTDESVSDESFQEPATYPPRGRKLQFLNTPPPPYLFCTIFDLDHIECVLTSSLTGRNLEHVLSLNPQEAWKYCDEYILIPHFDEYRANHQRNRTEISPLAKEIVDALKNQRSQPNSDEPDMIASQLTLILNRIKELEVQLVSKGNASANLNPVAPLLPLPAVNPAGSGLSGSRIFKPPTKLY